MKVTDLFHTKGCVAFEDAKRILGEAEYATARDMATAYLQGGGDWKLVVATTVATLKRDTWWEIARVPFQPYLLPADVRKYARSLCLQSWGAARYACDRVERTAPTDSPQYAAARAARVAGAFGADVECMPQWDRRSRQRVAQQFAGYVAIADQVGDGTTAKKVMAVIFEILEEAAE